MPQLHADPSSSTASSLLDRVRLRDGEAWRRFAKIYSPLVYGWARRGGLQADDAADVVQDVFHTVFAKIDTFQNDGQQSRFRAWLWAITRNRVRLFYRQAEPRPDARGGSDAAMQMQQYPDLLDDDSDPTSDDEQGALLRRALQLIQDDFTAATWQAFWRVSLEGEEVADVATSLGLNSSAVRQAKYRVLCRLREELTGL